MPKKLPFLPDEHHYAIAHVATRSAQLDHMVERSVDIQMMSQQRAAEYLIKHLDLNRLVDGLYLEDVPASAMVSVPARGQVSSSAVSAPGIPRTGLRLTTRSRLPAG